MLFSVNAPRFPPLPGSLGGGHVWVLRVLDFETSFYSKLISLALFYIKMLLFRDFHDHVRARESHANMYYV